MGGKYLYLCMTWSSNSRYYWKMRILSIQTILLIWLFWQRDSASNKMVGGHGSVWRNQRSEYRDTLLGEGIDAYCSGPKQVDVDIVYPTPLIVSIDEACHDDFGSNRETPLSFTIGFLNVRTRAKYDTWKHFGVNSTRVILPILVQFGHLSFYTRHAYLKYAQNILGAS